MAGRVKRKQSKIKDRSPVGGRFGNAVSRLKTRFAPSRRADTVLSGVDWSVSDVIVGSFRNENQYRINFKNRFYYTQLENIPKENLPIRYIAMYRRKPWEDPGIRYYGEVTECTVVKRRDIPVPMTRKNEDEPYYYFRVRRWIRLPKNIEIKEDGMYAPKFTNLFLLTHCTQTCDLFTIRSEEAFLNKYKEL